mmetsp:Transcript_128387/g.344470  ORF Transcript_128387/g.344470 Transcript_128387/m.344470 type:complete len:228 (+) Transcript_128387:973-1656(+)
MRAAPSALRDRPALFPLIVAFGAIIPVRTACRRRRRARDALSAAAPAHLVRGPRPLPVRQAGPAVVPGAGGRGGAPALLVGAAPGLLPPRPHFLPLAEGVGAVVRRPVAAEPLAVAAPRLLLQRPRRGVRPLRARVRPRRRDRAAGRPAGRGGVGGVPGRRGRGGQGPGRGCGRRAGGRGGARGGRGGDGGGCRRGGRRGRATVVVVLAAPLLLVLRPDAVPAVPLR